MLGCQVVQRSFDDLGTPLREVTFCVVDVETTGGDRAVDAITEIGAVKLRGGECLGTFATLVNPGRAIPPSITVLTGITEAMVHTAPRLEQVLPSLVEFLGGAVVVGHNVGFDLGFLNAALHRWGAASLANQVVDTLAVARRLVRDQVPDCRLDTLATRLRLDHRPTHRALDDALATADLLHVLLERAAGFGVMGLDDLVALPRLGGHPQAAKLRLTHHLPREPGVYRFLGAGGEVLYVGKATNLRQRVRSYFGGDDRRKVGALLRETRGLAHDVTPDALTAEVLETRVLHQLAPRYNRAGTTWRKYCYVRLTDDEPWPRLAVVNEPARSGLHVGPLSSRRAAAAVVEAVQSVFPLRRCSTRLGRRFTPLPDAAPCSAAQLGVAMCPCSGAADPVRYGEAVQLARRALTDEPHLVLDALTDRMRELAVARRFEEAAAVRDRAMAFAAALHRQRLADQLRRAGDVGVQLGAVTLHLRHGVLLSAHRDGQLPMELAVAPPPTTPPPAPLGRDAADEVLCLARAVDRAGDAVRVLWCSGEWAWPVVPVRLPERLVAA